MLFDVLQLVADELPGCELTSVVNLDSGLSLAAVTAGNSEDAAGADAFHSELYRLVQNAMGELGSQDTISDIVVQGKRRLYISTPLGKSGYFWHVATRADTTLGFTQAVMRKYREEVEAGVAALV